MKKTILLLLSLVLLLGRTSAQEKRFSFFPLPIIYYTPETKFVFGAGANATFRFKNDDISSKPSSITAGVAYSLNKQFLSYLNFNVFYNNNQYYTFGEAGFYKYSYQFYGIGNNEVEEEKYLVDFPRVKLNAVKLIVPNLYLGLGYQYEDYKIKQREDMGSLASDTILGGSGSRTSAAGAVAVYDSRDTVLYPYHGFYGVASATYATEFLGSTMPFSRYILDVSYYQSLPRNIVLALNSYNSFVIGDAPFQQQSLLGGNKKLRGYYEGRFIDKNQVALQVEARFTIYKRFGGVIFADAAVLGAVQQFLRTNDLKYTAGAGLRFNVNRKDHLNLRLDYAVGPGTSGFYFTVGEAF